MDSPRQTPQHSPNPSINDFQQFSFSASNSYYEGSPHHDRRYSKASASSFNESIAGSTSGLPLDGPDGGAGGKGLGNLADELAAFDDDGYDDGYGDGEGYDEEGASGYEDEREGAGVGIGISLDQADDAKREGVRDSGVDVESPRRRQGGVGGSGGGGLGVPSGTNGRRHRRAGSEYDGSEYGTDSDLESPGIPPRLAEKMAEVEALARRGTENNGSSADGTFKRVTDGLRDLGSQAGIEGAASRLITAHSALTTHLTHQTRLLHNLTYPLISSHNQSHIDPDSIDSLLPLLLSLQSTLPRPATPALHALSSLQNLTQDLIHTLNYLSDTLHMSRQTTTAAARKLKSARDVVAEMRRDEELREEGVRWLERGNWGERLARRECAHVCGEVVGGFEKVCEGWRERLVKALKEESSQA